MNVEDFIVEGYTRFPPGKYDDECVTDLFQKTIRDDVGNKLYFITVERWDYSSVAQERNIPISYNFSVQFNLKKGGTTQVDCFSEFDIESAEDFYNDLWNTGWFLPYEEI